MCKRAGAENRPLRAANSQRLQPSTLLNHSLALELARKGLFSTPAPSPSVPDSGRRN